MIIHYPPKAVLRGEQFLPLILISHHVSITVTFAYNEDTEVHQNILFYISSKLYFEKQIIH